MVGLERHKNVVGKQKVVTKEMFEKERFFDFRPDDASFLPEKNRRAREFYDRAREKFPAAIFVGDKYPQFFRFYGGIFKNPPEAKIVFIFRDPVHVAESWERRSLDSSDWSSSNDARKSIGYQCCTNLAKATPNFWRQVVSCEWQSAYNNLMSFGDAYPSRRRLEAAELLTAINSGTLPAPPQT